MPQPRSYLLLKLILETFLPNNLGETELVPSYLHLWISFLYVENLRFSFFIFHVHCISFCVESSLDPTKAKGKVLVCIHTGVLTESKLAKGEAVKEAGGVGVIVIDPVNPDLGIPFTIPAAVVDKKIGQQILSILNTTRFICSRLNAIKIFLYLYYNPSLYTILYI